MKVDFLVSYLNKSENICISFNFNIGRDSVLPGEQRKYKSYPAYYANTYILVHIQIHIEFHTNLEIWMKGYWAL